MDKVLKILVVFALLMLLIVQFYRSRAQVYHAYKLIRRASMPEPGDPDWVTIIAAGAEATPEAIDRENGLLFSQGSGQTIHVCDIDTGEERATIPVEDPADRLVFDPVTQLIYSYSLDGMLTIIRQSGREAYRVMQVLPVPRASRSLVLDPGTGRIYLTAEGLVWIYGPDEP